MSEKPNVVPFERDADFLRQRALKNQKDNHLIDALRYALAGDMDARRAYTASKAAMGL